MKRPLAYITAPWSDNEFENTENAAKYCRAVYDAGFFQAQDTTMVVSRGLGNSVFPLRLNNRPEIVLITLNTQ